MSEATKIFTGEFAGAAGDDWTTVSAFLRENPSLILDDPDLLSELGLKPTADNVVEFGPAALAHLSAAKTREKVARRYLEATARANFAAHAQTQAAVIELLEAADHADLARRIDEAAQQRFGLVAGVIAVEMPGGIPVGWRGLPPSGVDGLLGHGRLSRMGEPRAAQALFAERGTEVGSVAMVRLGLWNPVRPGVLVFGSPEPEGFTHEMGAELVSFLARVLERTAERWPAA